MHTEFTRLMSLALDNEASQTDLRRLHAHLETCPVCATTWAQWRVVDGRLAAAPLVVPAKSLAPLVSQRLAERALRRRRTRWVGAGLLLVWLSVFALVFVAISVLVGWVMGHPQQVAELLALVAGFLSGGVWLLRVLAGFIEQLGAPRLAAVTGLIATLTCGLGVIWLWVMGHRHSLTRVPSLTRQ